MSDLTSQEIDFWKKKAKTTLVGWKTEPQMEFKFEQICNMAQRTEKTDKLRVALEWLVSQVDAYEFTDDQFFLVKDALDD